MNSPQSFNATCSSPPAPSCPIHRCNDMSPSAGDPHRVVLHCAPCTEPRSVGLTGRAAPLPPTHSVRPSVYRPRHKRNRWTQWGQYRSYYRWLYISLHAQSFIYSFIFVVNYEAYLWDFLLFILCISMFNWTQSVPLWDWNQIAPEQ